MAVGPQKLITCYLSDERHILQVTFKGRSMKQGYRRSFLYDHGVLDTMWQCCFLGLFYKEEKIKEKREKGTINEIK